MLPPWTLLRILPLERAVRVGAAMGAAAMALDRVNRPVAIRNLTIAFPEMNRAGRLRILRDTYRNYGRMAAEWAQFPNLPRATVTRMVDYAGRENWTEAIRLSHGRGILILTGHFGNFELLSAGHAAHGNPVALVARPIRNPLIDRAVVARRARFGAESIPRKGAGRAIIRRLREDWMVAVPLDLDTRAGIFANFFSLPAATSPALARLAIATGAPVLPAFLVREGATTRHHIIFLPPLALDGEGAPRGVLARTELAHAQTQLYAQTIERMIRRHPDHWNWIHRRWKTRPPGEPRFY